MFDGLVGIPKTAEGNLIYSLEAATAEQLLDEIKMQGILEL
jgi:CheY-specific phosphatase CheX